MSGFDRALGALSRQEMLECARGLLKFLAGDAGTSPSAGGAAELTAGVRRAQRRRDSAEAESGAAVTGARDVAAAGRGGRRGSGGAGESERVRRGFDGPESPEGMPEHGGEFDGSERRTREGVSLAAREREAARDEVSGDAGAAFSGPERRYENAVGARGMEMSRVSDYFRRDSRRYDAGFTRY